MTLPTTFSRQNDATSRARTTKRLLHLLSPSPLGSLILRLSSFPGGVLPNTGYIGMCGPKG